MSKATCIISGVAASQRTQRTRREIEATCLCIPCAVQAAQTSTASRLGVTLLRSTADICHCTCVAHATDRPTRTIMTRGLPDRDRTGVLLHSTHLARPRI